MEDLEEGMKSRLSSKIWTLVLVNSVVLLAVLGFAYSAGRQSGGASIFDFGALEGRSHFGAVRVVYEHGKRFLNHALERLEFSCSHATIGNG